MSTVGSMLSVLISIMYPLGIALVFKNFKFKNKIWKYFLISFIAGIILFFIGLIRFTFTNLVPPPEFYWVSLIVTGFVEEGMKFLAIFLLVKYATPNGKNGIYYGLVVGLGFGAGEMLYILPNLPQLIPNYIDAIISDFILLQIFQGSPFFVDLFSYRIFVNMLNILVVGSSPNILGIPLVALYERLIVTLFHTSTAIIIGNGINIEKPAIKIKSITIKPKIIAYLLMVGLHIDLNFFAVLYAFGDLTSEIVEIIITIIIIPCFILATWLLLKSEEIENSA